VSIELRVNVGRVKDCQEARPGAVRARRAHSESGSHSRDELAPAAHVPLPPGGGHAFSSIRGVM
jgi:hypothetical protein